MFTLIFGLFVLSFKTGLCFTNGYGHYTSYPVTGDVGDALFLTPLIRAGKIEEAQQAAEVLPLTGNIKSYSGFLTVNDKFNSNLFFWFVPAEVQYETAPVVLWLQGGPGASSLFGLFAENGPFYVEKNLKVKLRKYSWSKTCSMVYIDNPVGTGYSFTDDDAGYSTNEIDVATNLYNALQQFFALFPKLRNNRFFVSGESYAGKYVPAISYAIHTNNPSAKYKINLQGLAIGNGLCDPEHMFQYGSYLYQLGLIDINACNIFWKKEQEALQYIHSNEWGKAFVVFDTLLNSDLSGTPSFFYNLTGLASYFNYVSVDDPIGDINSYIQLADIRKKIHVGNLTFHTDSKVEKFMVEDIMQSVVQWVEVLVENYKVLIYNGQLDIIVAYPLTLGFLQNMKWSGSEAYKTAPRHIWKIGTTVAGYCKTVNNLTEVLVRDAGHMVPMDQPLSAFDLINRFVFDKSFH